MLLADFDGDRSMRPDERRCGSIYVLCGWILAPLLGKGQQIRETYELSVQRYTFGAGPAGEVGFRSKADQANLTLDATFCFGILSFSSFANDGSMHVREKPWRAARRAGRKRWALCGKVRRVYTMIDAGRRSTRYLHLPPQPVEPVVEVGG